ncbi:site-specific integrase [Nocardia cyriacigeorgica]|nr:site-specific integrase [Nocardia cyriacigeorgica]MBF6162815.1 site-specific integrase [Nocardia cyriacigeorgica]MBF6201679.1 site-specific integrase [Nocardia cyriacigeorgica]MBF6320568.1 site-specific integrase [Nocardia cyriacigeorgica]MBF6518142.1 site-specific integrase [Nocardia cyriacigeorgica]
MTSSELRPRTLRANDARRIDEQWQRLDRRHSGPHDRASAREVLALIQTLPDWNVPGPYYARNALTGAANILTYLLTYPGDGWQDRWLAVPDPLGKAWLDTLDSTEFGSERVMKQAHQRGLGALILTRTVLPSYDFLNSYKPARLYSRVRDIHRPDLFARIDRAGRARGLSDAQLSDALRAICRIVLHTGRNVDQLTEDDLLEAHAWGLRFHNGDKAMPHLGTAWDLLTAIDILPTGSTLRARAHHRGQRPTNELVDDYGVRPGPLRDVLVRYLDERRASMDYSSFRGLVCDLVGLFWADVEHHHPEIDSFRLTEEVAQEWKQRLRTIVGPDGVVRERRNIFPVFMRVRAFYLDIQQWALEDATWAPWAAPSPVRRNETRGQRKERLKLEAKMHQRVRQRLPHLPLLVDTAEHCHAQAAALLTAAECCPPGEIFSHAGENYLRMAPSQGKRPNDSNPVTAVQVENLSNGTIIAVSSDEDDWFWAWAIIETFRHTGVRIEELTEITHLALVSYKLHDTGEVVPLLQIVPSKSNQERLLLVSPELASVLATIITRLRQANGGAVPLVTRYDAHEKVTGPELPHLFQRRQSTRDTVISTARIYRLLNRVLEASGLTDATGEPLTYTPHDFRRMFASEAVAGGLPVHIAAKVLGHQSLTTTQSYLAVFQDDLIRSYRAFLQKRRASRPAEEYREPTDEEWYEFQQHFQLRKVALGDCGRPYGSACQHEHACLRCGMLRVTPTQRPRLVEIIRNLTDRITEARMNKWLGEVEGLKVSLEAAKRKLSALDRSIERAHAAAIPGRSTHLGLPPVAAEPPRTSRVVP